MVFDSLSPPEQVEYLCSVLPLRQFDEIEEQYDEHSEPLVNELLLAGKNM